MLQFFSIALLATGTTTIARAAELERGVQRSLSFEDVDGNTLATADGHVTIFTVVTRESEEQAQAVADLVPDYCVGDPKYRYITVVNFQGKLARPFHGLTREIIRHRLDGEAKKLKPKYAAKKLTRDPRHDVYVVADFDGTAVTQLGLSADSDEVSVFVFNGEGKLIRRWTGVPPDDELPQAIATADSR